MKKGFTLLEILLVIAAVGILAAIVIVAINPTRQLQSARDAARSSDVNTLYKAVNQYLIENGTFPEILGMDNGTIKEVCLDGVAQATCESQGYVYLGDLTPTFIASIPTDPQQTNNGSGYEVYKPSDTEVSIRAKYAEQEDIVVGAPIPPFDPTAISGLSIWLDASTGITADGSNNVSSWADQSGNGRDFTNGGSNLPVLQSNVVNGNPALSFTGTETLNNQNPENYLNGLTEFTFFIVSKSDTVGNDRYIFSTGTQGNDQDTGLRYDSDGSFGGGTNVIKASVRGDGNRQQYESANNVQTTDWQFITFGTDFTASPSTRLYIDASLDTPTIIQPTATSPISGATVFKLGENWDGNIAEFIMYDSLLPSVELELIHDYLSEKYNI